MPHPDSANEQQFPEAKLETQPTAVELGRVVVSKLWIVTLLCAIVAGGLVAWQAGGLGPLIDVHFAEGYGLAAGDPVRYLGIEVGQVQEIVLDESLEGVVVRIQLTSAARDLAREGSRFWIERPDISVGKVHGLDTIVGGRFVGVLPGATDAPASREFFGLDVASAPVSNMADGLEITLESRDRYGLQSGSPITYRGVTVGQILAVGLTNDAATVEARAFIEPLYRELVREDTRFWSNSGVDVRIGLSGIELDAGTLATIAAGGVAFATPTTPGAVATTGQRFALAKSPREEWLSWQPRVAIGNAALPAGSITPKPVLGIRNQLGALGALGAGRERGWLLPLADGRLIGPASVLSTDEQETYQLEVEGQQSALPLVEAKSVGPLASGRLQQPLESLEGAWPTERIRQADVPEEVVITCGSAEATVPLSAQRLTAVDEGWLVDASVPLDASWQGASVIAARDGLVVGMLVQQDDRSLIVPISAELLSP